MSIKKKRYWHTTITNATWAKYFNIKFLTTYCFVSLHKMQAGAIFQVNESINVFFITLRFNEDWWKCHKCLSQNRTPCSFTLACEQVEARERCSTHVNFYTHIIMNFLMKFYNTFLIRLRKNYAKSLQQFWVIRDHLTRNIWQQLLLVWHSITSWPESGQMRIESNKQFIVSKWVTKSHAFYPKQAETRPYCRLIRKVKNNNCCQIFCVRWSLITRNFCNKKIFFHTRDVLPSYKLRVHFILRVYTWSRNFLLIEFSRKFDILLTFFANIRKFSKVYNNLTRKK
jgi:hypothetical protein